MSRKRSDDSDEEGRKPARAGLPVDLYRLVRAVRFGKWWLGGALVLGGVVGVLVAKVVMGRSYEATASIRYDGLPGQQMLEAQSDLPSLVSIAHSQSVMDALRRRMGLEDASIDAMRRMVEVEADNTSGLVSFTTTANGAERAATMANALVEIFLEHHRQRRRRDLNREIASLDERIAAANAELARARRRYDQFREANGITDLSAEQEQAITQAAELRSQADLAEAEVQALEARVRQLRSALSRTPRMEAVSSGASAQAQRLRELRARLAEMRASLSDEHPQVQAVQRQIQALSRSGSAGTSTRMEVSALYRELRTNLAEAETELETARRRHEALSRNAQAAQARTNRFSAIEGQAATLLAQVNVKEALVRELTEAKAHAEDQLRDVQTGFRSVAEARPPEDAVPSKKKYAVAAGIPLLFAFCVLGYLLYRELRGFYAQTPAEVAWWGHGPVIGATTWPRDARALVDLIADMDDFAPEATGTMLVVGATEDERYLAVEIASQLNHDWSAPTLLDLPVMGALPPPRAAADDAEEDLFATGTDEPRGIVLASSRHELALRNDVSLGERGPAPREFDDDEPAHRLICTAWTGASEGQALRRAARLSDRVLVVVTSNAVRMTELAQIKRRLGRSDAVGFVVVAVSDDVARLPDRAGDVEEFWLGGVPQ
ncbi:MAG TPA: hypothetical protein VIL20_18075 [Sandaracinaceae bacterium]